MLIYPTHCSTGASFGHKEELLPTGTTSSPMRQQSLCLGQTSATHPHKKCTRASNLFSKVGRLIHSPPLWMPISEKHQRSQKLERRQKKREISPSTAPFDAILLASRTGSPRSNFESEWKGERVKVDFLLKELLCNRDMNGWASRQDKRRILQTIVKSTGMSVILVSGSSEINEAFLLMAVNGRYSGYGWNEREKDVT